MDSSFEEANEEEDVGTKLDRIRAAQLTAAAVDSSDDGATDSDEDGQRELRWKQAKLSHSDAINSQGFSQDLSQSQPPVYCQQPSPDDYYLRPAMQVPVYRTIAAEEAGSQA
jgi:hypothetical protein